MRFVAIARISGLLGAFAFASALPGVAEAEGYVGRAVSLVGDPAPGTGGGTYSAFGFPASFPTLSDSGAVAFFAFVVGGTSHDCLFADFEGTSTAIALVGDAAPGTGGGTYSSVVPSTSGPPINSSGQVAFLASVTGGTTTSGVFLDSGGTDSAVVVAGDAAPGTVGGTYSGFNSVTCGLDDAGNVAFHASLTGGTASAGLFVGSGVSETVVALLGDTAPGTGGGTYSNFGPFRACLNESGSVSFNADVTGGAASEGIFVDSGGTDTAIALSGETAPGTGGGTYSVFGIPAINDSGDVAFHATVAGGTVSDGVFLSSAGTDSAVAVSGAEAPGTGGGTYSGFIAVVSLNNAGDVAFRAIVAGGTVSEGIFVRSGGTVTPVVFAGEVAPGTGGQTFVQFSFPVHNDLGQVATGAQLSGGDYGNFLFTPASVGAVPALSMPALGMVCLALLTTGVVAVFVRRRIFSDT